MESGPGGVEAGGRDSSVSSGRDALATLGRAAGGRRLDTLPRTGDYGYGVPLDALLLDPYVDEGGESE
jgi:hypothetical protein